MLYYQIALTSVKFDNSYKNVLRFNNRSGQEAYFKTNTLFSNDTQKVNFNVGSLYATNIIYEASAGESISDLLNKNYCIIKDTSPNKTLNYYYYFVTNAVQDNDNMIKLSLELDIFQTYYIDAIFEQGVIYRAHLNRFIDNGDGTVSFDGRPESNLFEREDIKNVAKRLTKRTVLEPYTMKNTIIDTWCKTNIYGWIYIYVDGYHDYTVFDSNGGTEHVPFVNINYKNSNNNNNYFPQNIPVLCYPIMNNSTKNIKFYDSTANTFLNITRIAGENFFKQNNDMSYVYSIKFSKINPLAQLENQNFYVDGDNLVIPATQMANNMSHYPTNDNNHAEIRAYKTLSSGNSGLILVSTQNCNDSTIYTLNKQFKFQKSEIIGADKNPKFNPKLLSNDYFELNLSDETENGFTYDCQKLNDTNCKILYTEPLVANMTKKYIRIDPNLNNVYIKDNSKNLLGYVGSNDTSFILSTSAYQNMLANNKNYFLQNSINRGVSLLQGTVAGGLGITGGVLDKKPLASVAGGISIINSGINFLKQKATENLTIDNLKSAPSSTNLSQGDNIFNSSITDMGIVVEEYDILDNEKEMVNDYMCLYGYSYNRIGNVKSFDNIRVFYNYVQADVEIIYGVEISETIHKKFRECFANGVRFWNSDTFQYYKENYERWIGTADVELFGSYPEGATMTYNDVTYQVGETVTTSCNDSVIVESPENTSIYNIVAQTDGTGTATQIENNKYRIDFQNAGYVTIKVYFMNLTP